MLVLQNYLLFFGVSKAKIQGQLHIYIKIFFTTSD